MPQLLASSVRTDLAVEAVTDVDPNKQGYTTSQEQHEDATVHRTHIFTPEAAQQANKAPGRYITVTTDVFVNHDRDAGSQVSKLLASLITELLPEAEGETLVIGLGNWNATPDALGPRVVNKLLITRHLKGHIPPELENMLKPVAALAPGVLGLTGMETGDIVSAVVDRIKPARVIVIDALAARDLSRLWRTIQLSDTGIHPGSGVAGGRVPLNRESLGIPTIAIGVPTVVPAAMIAEKTISALKQHNHLSKDLQDAPEPIRQQMLTDVLGQFPDRLLVTPKEVDVQLNDASRVLSAAVNLALQPEMDEDELNQYID